MKSRTRSWSWNSAVGYRRVRHRRRLRPLRLSSRPRRSLSLWRHALPRFRPRPLVTLPQVSAERFGRRAFLRWPPRRQRRDGRFEMGSIPAGFEPGARPVGMAFSGFCAMQEGMRLLGRPMGDAVGNGQGGIADQGFVKGRLENHPEEPSPEMAIPSRVACFGVT